MYHGFGKPAVLLAWSVALVATLGSLYFSEILKIPPCVLCWDQRVLMFPLVVILGVGIILKEKKLGAYVLPFSISGMGVATYHYFLQMGIIPEPLAPCAAGVSCADKQIFWLHFITIPFLSLIAFSAITLLMVIDWRTKHDE